MFRRYKNLFFDLDDTLCVFPMHTSDAILFAPKVLTPHVSEVLEYLKERYHLYILSNGLREVQAGKIRLAGLERYFCKVIVSEDIGDPKPYAPIFHFALSATQSYVEDSLMIGDSWEKDIVGAAGIGMHQVFYDVEGRSELPFRPTYHIKDLKELIELL